MTTGLVTFRAYRKFDYYRLEFMQAVEKSANAEFCARVCNRWVGCRLDLVAAVFGSATAAFAVAFKGIIAREQLTFCLQIITDLLVSFSISIRFYADLQNDMTSSQRVIQYTKLDSEDDLVKDSDRELSDKAWPSKGEIVFDNITMRYREHLDPAVKNLTFTVQPGMKVGIVGRTGAGKSSILQILFRLSDSESGRLLIDGVDCKTIGLHLLRKSIAYIP